ncbi:DUF418 domain-containing protein [Streptomyces sp. MUM 178J]|uniref:DUF418 domain-containing protein n=1 Tax=Streptomyces sp. MUM 178J TaxID=2791991 RepID=UPI001F0369B1|nr:DUF418 domain-containing protein [Streptomyces sp. MUM 178J]WRQ80677.1 DUF418 domain-containing protein [Streptomyces sp. MUM 178J]
MTIRPPAEPATHGPTGAGAADPATAPAAAPRLPDVDALRGFALWGILMVNITFTASAYQGTGVDDPAFGSGLDTAVHFVTEAFFEAKFYLLFSFLFGYSFTLQRASADRAGAAFPPRFLRRCAGLFVLGLCHAVLLFPGDILTTYALLGLVLLAVHRIRPRTAVRAAVALCLVAAAGYLLLAWAFAATGGGGVDTAAVTEQGRRATEALRGDAASVIDAHLRQLPDVAVMLAFFQAPAAFAAFLLGLAAGKRRVLTDLARHSRLLRRLQWAGFTVGVAGGLMWAHAAQAHPGTAYQLAAVAVDMVTAPLLAAAYAATVLRILAGPRGRRPVAVLAPAGRMTLTNYVAQSLVLAFVFTGYGAALVGRLAPAYVTLAALALFAAQALLSRWWLARHPYGPVEWVLRAVTLARRPRWKAAVRP